MDKDTVLQVLRDARAQVRMRDLVTLCGVTPNTIRKWASDAGVPLYQARRPSDHQEVVIALQAYNDGASFADIGRDIRRRPTTVKRMILRAQRADAANTRAAVRADCDAEHAQWLAKVAQSRHFRNQMRALSNRAHET